MNLQVTTPSPEALATLPKLQREDLNPVSSAVQVALLLDRLPGGHFVISARLLTL